MGNRKIRLGVLCLTGIIFLGGCGTEPSRLTEKEEDIIVSYAAHVVSKYNRYQGDGLVYVDMEEEDAQEEPAEAQDTESVSEEDNAQTETGSADGSVQETAAESAGLDEVFGAEGLHISYAGNELRKSYAESSVYALEASEGKTYLVLNFNLTNVGSDEIAVDYLSLGPDIYLSYTDNEGKERNAAAVLTFLVNDLSTYDAVIAAQASEPAVLLFEVPETVSVFDELVLKVKADGKNYSIYL